MSACPGSGRTYLRLSKPMSIFCPRCMTRLYPEQTGRIEWTLPNHTREGVTASDPWHPEGVYQCEGCHRTYPEYVNGCVEEHDSPRKVWLMVPEIEAES